MRALEKLFGKIALAHKFLKSIVKPNGELAQFGDNDSGRILPMSIQGQWLSPQEREAKYANLDRYSKAKSNQEELVENVLNVSKAGGYFFVKYFEYIILYFNYFLHIFLM